MKFSIDSNTPQLDITGAEQLDVRFRGDGNVLWVDVDGVTVLRVCRIEKFDISLPNEGLNRI